MVVRDEKREGEERIVEVVACPGTSQASRREKVGGEGREGREEWSGGLMSSDGWRQHEKGAREKLTDETSSADEEDRGLGRGRGGHRRDA